MSSMSYRKSLAALLTIVVSFIIVHNLPGEHQVTSSWLLEKGFIGLYWVALGILSSVGLGTGLHTFVLYLGPFIAKTTMAATECQSLDFARYGNDAFSCVPGAATNDVKLYEIALAVAFEAFLWGFGTAIGELPPYFIARQATLSNQTLDELNEDDSDEEDAPPTFMKRLEAWAEGTIRHYFDKRGTLSKAFFIMIFASIPNPLFDLAGLSCGMLLVPFTVFFIPTAIGKAVNKVSLQTFFIISVFTKSALVRIIHLLTYVDSALATVLSSLAVMTGGRLTLAAPSVQALAETYFENYRKTFHRGPADHVSESKPVLGLVWDMVMIGMVGWFLISIINAKARQRLAHHHKAELAAHQPEEPRGRQPRARARSINQKPTASPAARGAPVGAAAKRGRKSPAPKTKVSTRRQSATPTKKAPAY